MSAETHAALDTAIRDHFADEYNEDSGLATSWVLQASGVLGTDADTSAHIRETPDDQPVHITLGLIEYMRLNFRQLITQDDDE